jgi:hypothetical protein
VPACEQLEVDDRIERVELELTRCHSGQIPAARRRWPTHAALAFEESGAGEDAGNRADRRSWRARGDQGGMDGSRPVIAEITCLERRAQLCDTPLQLRRSPPRAPRGGRAAGPVDLVQQLLAGARQSPSDGRLADAKAGGHRALRCARPDRLHDQPPTLRDLLLGPRFFAIASIPPGLFSDDRNRTAGIGTSSPLRPTKRTGCIGTCPRAASLSAYSCRQPPVNRPIRTDLAPGMGGS